MIYFTTYNFHLSIIIFHDKISLNNLVLTKMKPYKQRSISLIFSKTKRYRKPLSEGVKSQLMNHICDILQSGLTPLHVASFMGCMNIVIFLLQHEANPDVPTVRGETPLHLAARANQTDIIRILLRNGAKVDARARVSTYATS